MLTILRSLLCAALVALIVLVYVKLLHVNPTTVAVSFLLAILVIAAAWGLRYAIPMSIASALCFNFFFLPPVGTLTIAEPQNWVALLAFFPHLSHCQQPIRPGTPANTGSPPTKTGRGKTLYL